MGKHGASSPSPHVHVSTFRLTRSSSSMPTFTHSRFTGPYPWSCTHTAFQTGRHHAVRTTFLASTLPPPCLVSTTAARHHPSPPPAQIRRTRHPPPIACPKTRLTQPPRATMPALRGLPLCALKITPLPLPTHKYTAHSTKQNPIQASSSTLQKWWLERSTRPPTRPRTLPWRRTASFTSMAARRTPPCPPSLIWPWAPATTKRVSYCAAVDVSGWGRGGRRRMTGEKSLSNASWHSTSGHAPRGLCVLCVLAWWIQPLL